MHAEGAAEQGLQFIPREHGEVRLVCVCLGGWPADGQKLVVEASKVEKQIRN